MTLRFVRIAALAVFATTFAACGGGQQSTPAVLPAPQSTPTSQTGSLPYSVLATSPTGLTVSGTVIAPIGGGFEIQGGNGVGYFNIFTTSSTVFTGAQPYAGEPVVIAGTGTLTGHFTATAVAQGAPVSASGPIVALKSGGFQIQGGRGVGYLNVWTTSGTQVNGSAPYVGESVKVFGVGSLSTSVTSVSLDETGASGATPTPSPAPTATPGPTASGGPLATVTPTPAPIVATPTPAPILTGTSSESQPAATSFMPTSWGKIAAMQVFDDTANGYISQSAASADGYRYAAVWGARTNIGTSWLNSNPSLETGYYNALETDESPTGWGAIGHSLSWWQTNHPDWILYACTSSGAVSTNPAWVPGLPNVPLDIHNPAVVDYQVRLMANYAHAMGYHALAIDETTFWQADEGAGSGSYGCGIHQNGAWVQRYTGVMDPAWAADVIAWVKQAHSILTTDPTISQYNLKLIVNHDSDQLTANEQALLANVDAVLNENGYSNYGKYVQGSASNFLMTLKWTVYAQQHGIAVLTNDNWGSVSVGTPQIDYSVATYLMGNEQAEALFAASANGYGIENWHGQYNANVGAPCGEYYSAGDSSNPSIYYRRFANAIVVVNGGSGSSPEVAHLPSGHTYTDLFGRAVSNPLTISSNDGYVLLTSNGCN